MTEQQPRFITRPYHRSLNQQITAIFQAAAKWSAETLPLADQAQLLLSTDRTLRRADFRCSFWDAEITNIVTHSLQQPLQAHSVSGCLE